MIKNDSIECVFINLIRSVINHEKPSALQNNISIDDIFELGCRQSMSTITFYGLSLISPKPKSDKWNIYQSRFLSDCTISESQMSEYHKLIEYLCSNGVKIIPLKGCEIKDYYFEPNFRTMCDIDLLYEGVTSRELSKLMEDFGYATKSMDAHFHDSYFKPPYIYVELHRFLGYEGSLYNKACENMFEKSVEDNKMNNLYHMKPEDLYISVITHLARHFRDGGIGVRPILDIYILNEKFKNKLHSEYILSQLRSVKLDKFENKIKEIAYAFFGDEEKEISKDDLSFIIKGGVRGNPNDLWKYNNMGINSPIKIIKFIIFLPYKAMVKKYPILNKVPFLLPLFWIYRWVELLFIKTGSLSNFKKNKISSKEIKQIQDEMKRFGLKD